MIYGEHYPESRASAGSTKGRSGEWRKQGFSGQGVCRTSIGAALRAMPLKSA
jgi:hypothetical protein